MLMPKSNDSVLLSCEEDPKIRVHDLTFSNKPIFTCKMFPSIQKKDYRVLDLVRQREIQDSVTHTIQQKLHITENLISRLGLEKNLYGHSGYVNCLEWNESGQVLASASNKDFILWDPFRYEKKLVLHLGFHEGILCVKFMPNDNVLVSCEEDPKIRVHDLTFSNKPIFTCACHKMCVEHIATVASIPFLFWSAGRDGFFLQHDIRTPHVCESNDHNVLVNLAHYMGLFTFAEGKCIAVNPRKPELIAIGTNDAYIRMYDRRMIKLSQIPPMTYLRKNDQGDNNYIPLDSAQYFIAGHLRYRNNYIGKTEFATTHLTFSDDGNELLVNMGKDQIYLFDINDPNSSKTFFGSSWKNPGSIERDKKLDKYYRKQNDVDDTGDFINKNVKILPPHVEEVKRLADEGFDQQKYSLAINLYNKAISNYPTAAVLFVNRAAAYMKRAWDGDIYAALRDCKTTLLLDPEHVEAHFRLARCLFDLNQPIEADKVLENFEQKFPVEYASNSTCEALKRDIKEAICAGKDVTQTKDITQTKGTKLPIHVKCTRQFYEQKYDPPSKYEQEWRRNAIDYKMRFCGNYDTTICNIKTGKEANFFGNNEQYIVAGSNDGSFFIWDRNTTNIVRVLRGDEKIVRCLQSHPSMCLLATCGMNPIIRLWSPLPEISEEP